jgi:hypothetical protein
VAEPPAGWGPWGQGWPAEVLALRYELGGLFAAIFVGLRRALRLWLRIADGLGQHLAQLSLGLRGFAFGWLPLGHELYVGMRQGEFNPGVWPMAHVRRSISIP